MKANEYATLVLPNGNIIKFRRRDADFPRFKVSNTHESHEMTNRFDTFKDKNPYVDLDDCDAKELGLWILELWKDGPE